MTRSALDETSASGAFVRTSSTFRNFISRDPNSSFPTEAGRYHLYVSYACPWASRSLACLKIKGLDKAITFTSVKPQWEMTKDIDEHMGWVFPASNSEEPGADPDSLNGAKSIRDLYELASTNYSGKYTIPVYAVHFKCNKKLLREYPNIFNFTKDIFQITGVSSTVHMAHIKKHYYGSHPTINPFGIIPHDPNIDYSSSHDWHRFSK